MARPLGITVIAILNFLSAAGGVAVGIWLIAKGSMSLVMASFATFETSSLGVAFILYMITFPILYLLAGWSVWKLREWGRILTIALMVYFCAFVVLRWMFLKSFTLGNFLQDIVGLAFAIPIAVYLLKPDIKAAFSTHLRRQ